MGDLPGFTFHVIVVGSLVFLNMLATGFLFEAALLERCGDENLRHLLGS
jgi:hypothetical protein